jgi:hypothetical protein
MATFSAANARQLQAALSTSQATQTLDPANLLPRGLSNPGRDPLGFTLQVAGLLFGSDFIEANLNGLVRQLCGDQQQPGPLEVLVKGDLYRLCVSGLGGKPIPAQFSGAGYVLPTKLVDLFELLGVEPGTPEGPFAQGKLVRAIVENILRRPGVRTRLPDIPYLSLEASGDGLTVTVRFDPSLGPQPAPATCVDLLAEMIYHPDFRLLDPGRVLLDVLDVILGITAERRGRAGLEREELLADMLPDLVAEVNSETLRDFDAPALVAASQRVTERRTGLPVASDCQPRTQRVNPAQVPLVEGPSGPDWEATYRELIETTLRVEGEPGSAGSDALRDSLSSGLVRRLVLVLLRNTVLAPGPWLLILVSRILTYGYPATGYDKWISRGIASTDWTQLLRPTRPLLATVTRALTKTAVDYLTERLLIRLERELGGLLKKVAAERTQAYQTILESLFALLRRT